MLKFVKILPVFFVLFHSCNTKEKEREEAYEQRKNDQLVRYQSMIKNNSAFELNKEELSNKFSFELFENYKNESVVCVAKIFDIRKSKGGGLTLFARGDDIILKLSLDEILLNKILKIRSELMTKYDDFYFFEFAFLIKPKEFKRNLDLYEYISDFDYEVHGDGDGSYGDSYKEVELTEYSIELELENDGFLIEGEMKDVVLVDKLFFIY